jgi:hypothetical protein
MMKIGISDDLQAQDIDPRNSGIIVLRQEGGDVVFLGQPSVFSRSGKNAVDVHEATTFR